jgi:hypothetical protein
MPPHLSPQPPLSPLQVREFTDTALGRPTLAALRPESDAPPPPGRAYYPGATHARLSSDIHGPARPAGLAAQPGPGRALRPWPGPPWQPPLPPRGGAAQGLWPGAASASLPSAAAAGAYRRPQ